MIIGLTIAAVIAATMTLSIVMLVIKKKKNIGIDEPAAGGRYLQGISHPERSSKVRRQRFSSSGNIQIISYPNPREANSKRSFRRRRSHATSATASHATATTFKTQSAASFNEPTVHKSVKQAYPSHTAPTVPSVTTHRKRKRRSIASSRGPVALPPHRPINFNEYEIVK